MYFLSVTMETSSNTIGFFFFFPFLSLKTLSKSLREIFWGNFDMFAFSFWAVIFVFLLILLLYMLEESLMYVCIALNLEPYIHIHITCYHFTGRHSGLCSTALGVLFLPATSWVQFMKRWSPFLSSTDKPTRLHRVSEQSICEYSQSESLSHQPSEWVLKYLVNSLGIFKHLSISNNMNIIWIFNYIKILLKNALAFKKKITHLDSCILKFSTCVRK